MGGALFRAKVEQFVITTNWRSLLDFADAKTKYVQDKTLDPDCCEDELELRVLLDDPIANKYFFRYGEDFLMNGTESQKMDVKLLELWHEFSRFPPVNPPTITMHMNLLSSNRTDFIKSVFKRYESTFSQDNNPVGQQVKDRMEGPSPASTPADAVEIYKLMRKFCVRQIFIRIFQPYKRTMVYLEMCDSIRTFYNSVSASDFTYKRKIAEGGFGVIIHCVKRSTGIEYAMKIQSKAQLLKHFKKDPSKVLLEMQAYARCVHPYLSGLEYAFHTPSLAVLVMPLASCGDLRKSLGCCPGGVMSFERVQFYTAEITDALCFLHFHGILYRDLKPTNILLNADGHIRLADFGSVADMRGKLRDSTGGFGNPGMGSAEVPASPASERERDNSVSIHTRSHAFGQNKPLSMTKEIPSEGEGEEVKTVKVRTRTGSLVGTLEYMAPEIIIMFGRQRLHREGYTDAVDWWSLGITVYKLLVGVEPYRHMTYDKLIKTFPGLLKDAANYKDAFSSVFGVVNYNVSRLNEQSKAFISGLLQFDASKRLGTMDGQESYVTPITHSRNVLKKYNSIRQHSFFEGLDWGKLENKQLPPPYLPVSEIQMEEEENKANPEDYFPPGVSLNDCMLHSNKSDWICGEFENVFFVDENQRERHNAIKAKYSLTTSEDMYFDDWNHCSLNVIGLEIEAQALEGSAQASAQSSNCLPWL